MRPQGIALAIRHLPYQDLGLIAPILLELGFSIEYLDVTEGEFSADIMLDADLLIILGGPFDVNDPSLSFLAREIEGVRLRIGAGLPVLGICLGAQVVARSLGAAVREIGAMEIGWKQLDFTPDGRSSSLFHLANMDVLHWHGDGCELPLGATCLAFTDICSVQAFSAGPLVLGLQFHIEVGPTFIIENWIDGHRAQLAESNISPLSIREQTMSASLGDRSGVYRFLREWIYSACFSATSAQD